MKRRDLLAGLGCAGLVGVGGATVISGNSVTGPISRVLNGEEDHVESLELPRIEAPGSPPGTERIPEEGTVTYLALFATWCTICQGKMEPLGEAYERLQAADKDVQFVSVTNEALGHVTETEDVRAWWERYDGSWPVAHDADMELTMAVDSPGVPYSVVFDADNRITWTDTGYKTADELIERIRDP